jgi:hypothetical protein
VYDFPGLSGNDMNFFCTLTNYQKEFLNFIDDVAKDNNYLLCKWKGLNLNFPKNNCLDSLLAQIQVLGPSTFLDTSKI